MLMVVSYIVAKVVLVHANRRKAALHTGSTTTGEGKLSVGAGDPTINPLVTGQTPTT